MCVAAAYRVNLGHILGVLRELDDQPVGRTDIDRFAIAVIGLAVFLAGALEPLLQLLIGVGFGLEGDVVMAADLRRLLGLGQLVHLWVGELEEGESAAIRHAEKGVAELDLLLHLGAVIFLAPGGDQRDAEDVLEEATVDLVVAHYEGVVMQARRQFRQQLSRHFPPPLSRMRETHSTDASGLTVGAAGACCRPVPALLRKPHMISADLSDKAVLVTGAASGIGLATAE